jgi:hypothetical protein
MINLGIRPCSTVLSCTVVDTVGSMRLGKDKKPVQYTLSRVECVMWIGSRRLPPLAPHFREATW